MNIQEFVERYKGEETLYDIPWADLPDELQAACQQFINRWFANTDIDDLREISGFNDMSVEELLRYTRGELPDDEMPLGEPFERVCWWVVVIVHSFTEVFNGND